MKKLIKIVVILLIGIIIALALIPFLFKDQIVEKVKESINDQVNASVDFEDVSLSLFKSFPKLSITLEGLSIQGKDEYSDVTLMKSERNTFAVDVMSAIKQDRPIEIKNIALSNGEINVLVNKNGKANYDIMKESEESTSESSLSLKIDRYSINNFDINYTDKSTNNAVSIEDLDHEGSGDFQNQQFQLDTETQTAAVNMYSGGIKYLNEAVISSNAKIGVDLDKSIYTFDKTDITLNALTLLFDGKVENKTDDINMDLSFQSSNNDIRNLISLIPGLYQKGIENAKVDGQMGVKGKVNGIFNAEKETYPTFDIQLKAKDGYVSYPDLPTPLKDINLDAKLTNNTSNLDGAVMDIQNLNVKIGEEETRFKLLLTKPISNPTFDFEGKGNLDLANLISAVPVEGINLLQGQTSFDIKAKGNQQDIESENYQNIDFKGSALLKNIVADIDEQPKTNIDYAAINFSPKSIDINDINAQVGNSDFAGTSSISDPLQYMVGDNPVNVNLNLTSNNIDLDEWITEETTVDTLVDNSILIGQLSNVNMTANLSAAKVKYTPYEIKATKMAIVSTGEKLNLKAFDSNINGNTLALNGNLDNVFNYGLGNETLTGKLNLTSNNLDLNTFLSEEETTEEVEPIVLPDNMDIDIATNVKSMIFQKIKMENVQGIIAMKANEAKLKNFTANGLGGKMHIDGTYNTLDPQKPFFDFDYDLSNLQFAETYASVNTFRALAPIAEFLQGIFNSNVKMSGVLDPISFMPDLNTLSLEGILETIDGKLSGFGPVEKVKSLFDAKGLKDWTLENTKSYVEVKDGIVIMKDFPFQWDGIDFNVKGKHGINQDMNYVFETKVPREKLKNNALTKLADEGATKLLNQINKTGINVDLNEIIEMDLILTGNIANPKIKIVPKGFSAKSIKDQVKDQVNDKMESAKDSVKTVINQTKGQVVDLGNTVKDSVKNVITEEKDKIVESGKDKVKDILSGKTDSLTTGINKDSIVDNVKDKASDIINGNAKDQVDSLKEKIGGWNPFKKKKK